jgi:uncharacterized protein YeaC (DUF1315 family)
MEFQQLIESITPEIYNKLKSAVEVGKWPDGTQMTPIQKDNTLQAIIAYDALHKPEEERVGYVPPKKVDEPCDSKKGDSNNGPGPDDEQPVKWQE